MTAPTAPAVPAPSSSRKRSRWGRRLLVLLLALVLFVAFAPLLVGVGFVRDRIAAAAGRAIGRPVAIAALSASWTKGVDIEGLRVDSPPGFDEPLATVKHAHLGLDLKALLGGRVDAQLEVDSPWITFLEDDEGRSNAEGFFAATPEEPREATDEALPRLRVRVRDGLIRAQSPCEELPEEVRDVNADLALDPDGRAEIRFRAVASRAALEGQDAHLTVEALLPADGEGKVDIDIPELDLARIGQLIECTSGICEMRGRMALKVRGIARPGPAFSGELRTDARDLAFCLPAGDRFAVKSIEVVANLLPGAATSIGDVLVRAKQVVLGPGALSLQGYVDPEIVLRVEAERPTTDHAGATVVRLQEARSAILDIQSVPGSAPLTLTSTPDATGAGPATLEVDGVVEAALDLDAVARAFGAALGLEPTDRMAGVLKAQANVALQGGRGKLHATLLGAPLTLPKSWGRDLRPTRVEGKAEVTLGERDLVVSVPRLTGLGMDLKLLATLLKRDGTYDLQKADCQVAADLGRARPFLAPLLELEPKAALTGTLQAATTVAPEGDHLRLRGAATVAHFRWQDETGRLRADDVPVGLRHDALIAREEGEPHRLESVELTLPGLRAALAGSLLERAGEHDLDARMTLSGDAAKLARTLAVYLGEEYADLVGRGPIEGTLAVTGRTGKGGEALLANGKLVAGGWSTGGLELLDARLDLERKNPATAQTLRFASQVNGGTLAVDAQLRPGRLNTSWQASLNARGIDTSKLLVSQGLGRYLTYLFPTIVPMDASTNVLSGKLDADLNLAAADLAGDRLAPTLAGQGRLTMAQGRIGESTLFEVATQGGGLGKIGQILAATVPEIGKELKGLSRHLTFHRLESRFDVAKEILTIRHGMLEGERVNISFPGRVAFDQRMDLKLLVTLGGKAGERLGRILPSKTIPLTARGTLSDPVLTPDLKASDLQAGALKGLIPGGGEGNPVDRLRDLFGK